MLAFEDDPRWIERVRPRLGKSGEIVAVSMESRERCVADVRERLDREPGRRYDVVVIDGLYREELPAVAIERLSQDGAILCDNAAGYGLRAAFLGRGFDRVDFFGYAPGELRPHCTAIYFRQGCFLFDSNQPLPEIDGRLESPRFR